MSYIRYTQEGQYIDIPEGSVHYLYSDGSSIKGWSHGEFAGILNEAAVAASGTFEEYFDFHDALCEEFGCVDTSVDPLVGVRRPEKAEIFCRVVDKRTDVTELTDENIKRLQQWVDEERPYDR